MARTLATIKSILNSKLAQASVNITDTNIISGINLALDTLGLRMDFKELEKTSALQPFFTDVNSYEAPSDLRGNAILYIRPYPSGDMKDDLTLERSTVNQFDSNYFWDNNQGTWAIEYNQDVKTLRLLKDVSDATNHILHSCNTYDGNGTWTADTSGSDATNVATETGTYLQGSGSVSFDIDVSASANNYALVYNDDFTAVDLGDLEKSISYAFLDIYLPTADITSIELRWGSDASNYYSKTETSTFTDLDFSVGWNTLGFEWDEASTTGTPDDDNIDYLAVKVNYAASLTDQTGVKIDNIVMREGGLYQIRYLTKYAVKSNAGTYKQYFTADDDTLVVDEDGEAVFIDYIAGELAPNALAPTGQTFYEKAQESLKHYRSRYPSMRKKTTREYYNNYV